MSDKFSATWVSHSSISDFLKCPRSYYLKNVYKDPKTRHKFKVMSPPLALGQAVHEVLESLSIISRDERFNIPLTERLNQSWEKIKGSLGGFPNDDVEYQYKKRAEEMLSMVYQHPGPLKRLAIKIQDDLPHYWLSEDENIILCGKIDWLEYLPEDNSVHIIDFKTGKSVEETQSLQLPIYHLLVHNCQHRKVSGASYWYLASDQELASQELPDLEEAHQKIFDVAKQIKLARQLERFKCPSGEEGCMYCRKLERVMNGEGTLVGTDQYGADIYILKEANNDPGKQESIIL